MNQRALWVGVVGTLLLSVACQKAKESTADISARNLRTGDVVKFDSAASVPADYVVCADKDCLQLLPPPPEVGVTCAAGTISITDCSGGLVPVRDEAGCVVRFDCVPHCQAGSCAADRICDRTCADADPGLCIPKPAACPDVLRPVCGCDGKQYQNDCLRLVAGVRLQNDGPCRKKCGTIAGLACAAGEVCDLQSCAADAGGTCVKRPQACPEIWAPVCGCDGKTYDNDCSRLGAGASLSASGQCPAPTDLKWYNTCGDPVCRVDPAPQPSGLPACTASQGLNLPCTQEGETCDFGGGCGVKRICAKKDPSLGPCPISNRAKKSDIRYLSEEALQGVAGDVARIRLAEYRYSADPQGKAHLGFIIEDMPESQAVAGGKNMVDLYGYTSMVVAALQVQKKALEEQQRELEALRRELSELRKTLSSR